MFHALVANSGKDGSRAFVTGDFSDSGLTDDVSDLTNSQWLDLLHWFQFYDKQYVYIGKMLNIFLMYMYIEHIYCLVVSMGWQVI